MKDMKKRMVELLDDISEAAARLDDISETDDTSVLDDISVLEALELDYLDAVAAVAEAEKEPGR